MKPGRERLSDPKRARLPNQDQESCLERVLGVVRISDQSLADPPDHRAVPLDQCAERHFGAGVVSIPIGCMESFEELLVRQA
jgi:hypothetical protein